MTAKIFQQDPYWAKIVGLRGTIVEMLDNFMSVRVPGAFYSPSVRSGQWDGKKHWFSKATMRFPYFFSERVRDYLVANGTPCEIEAGAIPVLPANALDALEIPIELRDYQVACIKACITVGHGIIQSPTSSGKTAVIASVVKLFDKKTLILVNRKNLAEQIADRLKKFGVPDIDIVHSESSKGFKNRQVCISLVQSIDQIAEHLSEYELLIVDEVHFAKAKSFIDVAKKCKSARNRFGFSATVPDEKTNDGLSIFAIFGAKCYDMSVTDLLNRKEQIVADPLFIFIQNNKEPVYTKEGCAELASNNSFVDMENRAYVYNMYRNTLIAYITEKYVQLGEKVLILVRREDHGKILESMLDSAYMNGGMALEERKDMIRKFEKGETSVLLAQTEILGVGIDIQGGCGVFIVASGGKGEISVIQRVGRAMRANTAMEVTVFDFMDDIPNIPMAKEHSQARLKICKNTYEDQRVTGMDIDPNNKVYEAVQEACK